jgi:tripartite-type tricarboxylate transporter receptor subunit TctC
MAGLQPADLLCVVSEPSGRRFAMNTVLHKKAVAILGGSLLAVLVGPGTGFAQQYPSKPIRMVVPFPAGGGVDVIGRIVGQQMSDRMGHQVVADNRAGASGSIAAEIVANAPPDGYTVLFALDSVITANPHLLPLTYDPLKDLAPVSRVGVSQLVIVVNPNLPAKSLKEFIALAKTRPGKLNIGSAGIGSSAHLGGELFVRKAGIELIHVPYKGSPQALTDVVSGQIEVTTPTLPAAMGMIKSGRVRALAVTGNKRSAAMPDLPTAAEAGLPGYDVEFWVGFLAPAKTPAEIIEKLALEIKTALEAPSVRAGLANQGMEPAATTPQMLFDIMSRDSRKWATLIKEANIRIGK